MFFCFIVAPFAFSFFFLASHLALGRSRNKKEKGKGAGIRQTKIYLHELPFRTIRSSHLVCFRLNLLSATRHRNCCFVWPHFYSCCVVPPFYCCRKTEGINIDYLTKKNTFYTLRLIVPDFTIPVYSSSCNFLIISLSLLSFLLLFICIPKAGLDTKKEIKKEKKEEWDQKRKNYINCRSPNV